EPSNRCPTTETATIVPTAARWRGSIAVNSRRLAGSTITGARTAAISAASRARAEIRIDLGNVYDRCGHRSGPRTQRFEHRIAFEAPAHGDPVRMARSTRDDVRLGGQVGGRDRPGDGVPAVLMDRGVEHEGDLAGVGEVGVLADLEL